MIPQICLNEKRSFSKNLFLEKGLLTFHANGKSSKLYNGGTEAVSNVNLRNNTLICVKLLF